MQNAHDDPRIGLLLIGFSPADRLDPIARRLGWTGAVLSDPDRELYRRLGIGRAPWWRVYTPATLAIYVRARRAGRRPSRPTGEDTRQLGADAIMVGATVLTLWRPRSPDDRPSAADVLDEGRRALATGGPASDPA
ncbi:hypothetical protein SAMN05661080_02138 [Modestobacter sp. DSM 44400]|uniref:AhpC/TSA family protein n=1 Tax=Modestobacter sp. DSM 44400 TaxID=1550230 RepID=UPI000896D403|nr:AhpC/TSA family protein [Modestobacter sp. DSM 44400]SDY04949.1 hypothetical protein SAMN05661080_02138 [Modestobacter sp. DSM 44400]